MSDAYVLPLLGAGLLLGWALTLLFAGGGRVREAEERAATAESERSRLESERAVLHGERDAARAVVKGLEVVQAGLATKLEERGEAHAQTLARVEQRVSELAERNDALDRENGRLRAQQVELETRQAEQQRRNEERQREFDEARRRMTTEFENLANRILEEKGKRFSEQNRTGLDELLRPVRDQLGDFRRKVEEVHLADTRERASLREQIDGLKQLNLQMNDEARNLTRALKGDKKAQGNWGEVVLERVLERSGLRRGEEYEVQGSFRDAERRLLRPDVIVHLPEGRDIVVDSKVSLVAWSEYVAEEEGAVRDAALKAHVQALRNHLQSLSAKKYDGLQGLRSLDFVLMFVPVEAAFTAAFQADEKLFVDAFDAHIVVVTPTTLLATLRTVENIWRYERQNENARKIAASAGRIYDKLRGFLDEFEKIGIQLATTQRTFDSARNKLTDGRGNLVRQVAAFRDLGARVRQEIAAPLLDRAGVAGEDDDPGNEPEGVDDGPDEG